MTGRLEGRKAIVTGANRGLGLEIAESFLAEGADVAMGARDEAVLTREAQKLRKRHPERTIVSRRLDVTSEESCNGFVQDASVQLGRIDVLVNNAGIYGPMGDIETVSWPEWVEAIQVNLFGSVLMTRAVLPVMKAQRSGAIIQISGGGATNPMPKITAYAASKAAVVRFAESLALEVRPYGITVNSIAPGALNTRLLDEVLKAGPEKVGEDFYQASLKQHGAGGVPLAKGADLAVFLASDDANRITGRLISAVWDLFEDWPLHTEELNRSDLYTLRRITGRERGVTWGDRSS